VEENATTGFLFGVTIKLWALLHLRVFALPLFFKLRLWCMEWRPLFLCPLLKVHVTPFVLRAFSLFLCN
jgi:hypothetical protein